MARNLPPESDKIWCHNLAMSLFSCVASHKFFFNFSEPQFSYLWNLCNSRHHLNFLWGEMRESIYSTQHSAWNLAITVEILIIVFVSISVMLLSFWGEASTQDQKQQPQIWVSTWLYFMLHSSRRLRAWQGLGGQAALFCSVQEGGQLRISQVGSATRDKEEMLTCSIWAPQML